MKKYDYAILGSTSKVSQHLIPYIISHPYFTQKKFLFIFRNKKKWEIQKNKISITTDYSEREWDGLNLEYLESILKDVSVLINMAGPFYPWAMDIIRLSLKCHTHYLDITGEVLLVKEVIELFEKESKNAKVNIVPCAGFDSTPSDFLSFLIAEKIFNNNEELKSIELTFNIKGGVNGGSFLSAINIFENTPTVELMNQGLYTKENLPVSLNQINFKCGSLKNTFFMEFINNKIVRRTLLKLSAKFEKKISPSFTYREYLPSTIFSPFFYLSSFLLLKTLSSKLGRMLARKFGPVAGSGPSENSIVNGKVNIYGEGKSDINTYNFVLKSSGDPGNIVTSKCVSLIAAIITVDSDPGGVKTPSQLLNKDHVNWAQKFDLEII